MRHHFYIVIFAALVTAHAAEPPTLVTGGLTNVAGASDSFLEAITPEGRWAVFVSHANNLTTNDDLQPYSDIFVRDLQGGRTLLVSVSTNGSGGGNGNSKDSSISSDGRYVIFASDASNLIPNDTNGVSDVFRRDLQTGTTELVSVARSGGVASASMNRTTTGASGPIVTPDGKWVVFESASTEFVEGDTNPTGKIFVRDMQTGITRLATENARYSRLGSITDDGRFIAFIAQSASSMPGRTNSGGDAFVGDLQTGQQFWASTNLPSPIVPAYRCYNPVVARDGQTVWFNATVFSATYYNPDTTYLLEHHLTTAETTVITPRASLGAPLALSADERWLAYEDLRTIYLRDRQDGSDLAVANGSSPVITSDARHLAFVGLDDQQIYIRDTVAGTNYRVRATSGAAIKVSAGVQALITADGKTVFFDTAAPDAVANDSNGAHDVFRHDVRTGVTDLVSVAEPLRPSRSAMRSATFDRDVVDATATRIAFISPDIPGIPGDTNGFLDAFVRDVATGMLFPFPTQYDYWATNFSASMKALDPQISADGVVLTFVRQHLTNGVPASSDLVWQVIGGEPPLVVTNVGPAPSAISSNGQAIVYQPPSSSFYTWHDLATERKTSILGIYPEVDPFPSSLSPARPVISGDQRWLAFRRSGGSVIIYNVRSNSVDIYQPPFNDISARPGGDLAFTADSRFLFFEGSPVYTVYRRELQTRLTDLICTNCINPSSSADGNIVAYNYSVQGGAHDIIVNDLRTGIAQVITTEFTPTNTFLRRFSAPSISADGRYVVFSTSLTNSSAGDFNSHSDVYVYDRVQRSTLLVSRSRLGEGPAAGSSTEPVVARDGRSMVFQSFANDLVEGDYNQERDIFILRLGVGDSDSDGMDDDWEVAQFGDLNRDGAGDQDGDGQTDLQEFLAGTNPTNSGSILRVLTITRLRGSGSTTVVWSAVAGRSYVVQYKDSLDATWTNASGAIEADSTSMSFAHSSSSPQRFYRVVAVQ
jgi:Tol biopolymer transport system component